MALIWANIVNILSRMHLLPDWGVVSIHQKCWSLISCTNLNSVYGKHCSHNLSAYFTLLAEDQICLLISSIQGIQTIVLFVITYVHTCRYRQISTFGSGTIRKFSQNSSEMKKLAARDFEDLLQVKGFSSK